MPPGQLIGVEPVRGRAITAEKLAVNAVMAGCLPSHVSVVVAAFMAMLREPFLLHGATASTGGCAVLIVVNGPVRKELGMSGTFNALGGSDRASPGAFPLAQLGQGATADVARLFRRESENPDVPIHLIGGAA